MSSSSLTTQPVSRSEFSQNLHRLLASDPKSAFKHLRLIADSSSLSRRPAMYTLDTRRQQSEWDSDIAYMASDQLVYDQTRVRLNIVQIREIIGC